ncbi:BapA/Bap/LapF family large adhesin [Sphingomonas sp. M6A6_1c]
MNVEVISKANGTVNQVAGNSVDLDAPSIVRLDLTRAQIAGMDRQGQDLVIRLVDGQTVRIADFYPANATTPNDLVLREPDGHLWVAHGSGGAARFASLRDLADLTATASEGGSSLALPAMLLGGAAAAGGIVAIASGGGSDATAAGSGAPTPDTGTGTGTGTGTPDTTPPAVPVASVRGDGSAITGRGEAGATITVRDAAGTVIATTTVSADGSYTAVITPARIDNERLTITQTDTAGNVSPAVVIQAPDLTAPTVPTAAVDATGATVSGRGEAGATVTVRDAAGTVLGTALVATDGSYTVTLSTPQANGGALSVSQSDAAGNVSPTVAVAAPDITAPAAPTVAVDGTGTVVTGTGEPGARVTITDPAGTTLATVTVAADGSYSATLATAQVNGERLDARQTDAAGNASGTASTVAPDLTAPGQPTAAITADGASVSGAGEAGARITIVNAAGTVLGTALVGADGTYTVALTPAQANGETLTVRESDAAGNQATPLALTAPDITPPAAPVATLDATGTTVTGTGEPGATIVVRDAAGTALGSATVGAQGSYAVVLATPQVDSQSLAVTQTDAAGNASPATPLTAPDLTAPAAPTIAVAADGASVSGVGEPGAAVTIRDPLGTVIATATVAANGTYAATLSTPQIDGEVLSVRQADAAGNVSPVATATAPDLIVDVLPAAPTAAVTGDGTAVTGVAAGGAAITLYDANGVAIGTGTAAADGSYSVALTPARLDGETIRVTQADAAGAVSPPATAIAPDLTAPAAPTAAIDATGQIVTGTAEAGATVTVRDASGAAVGTATANAAGEYAVQLGTPQANGGTLAVTQADGAGNVSAATGLAAPDITAPAAPSATVATDGNSVTGIGEAGATVTVRDAAGNPLGTAVVATDGSYSVVLTVQQGNGQTVTVTQADPTGNASPATTIAAPDFTAPGAPTASVAAGGSTVIGTGEPGATVTVTAADGTVLGTDTVAANGSYAVTLATPQANGEALTVVQADPTGNTSPPLAFAAPDLTPPPAPAATLDASGRIVTGTGEIGATVTVRDSAGALLGSAIVTAQGNYSVTLATPQVDRQTLVVGQADGAGNASPTVALTAPDITAPLAPTATVGGDGLSVTGTGEAGATISIRNPVGLEIGTAIVAGNGSYTATLSTAQVDGEVLTVRQTDAANNVSPVVNATAPDIAPGVIPMPPSATVTGDGSAVTGRAMGSAAITVYSATGIVIATGTAAADGSYSVALATPRVNGETVFVTQTDAIGASPPTTAIAPDLTAPTAPTATLDPTGAVVTGTGEAGATVVVRDLNGTSLGTAIVTTAGSYAVTLSAAQVDGQVLAVTQADRTGNVSPAIPLVAPDFTAPPAPVASVGVDGTFVSGTGEPGTIAMVRDAAGNLLGTGTVDVTGGFNVQLTTAQVDGESVRVTLTDATGNVSPTVTVVAPDFTAPAAPTLAINGDGTVVTGSGEAGALVTITNAAGAALGTATVAADGSFTVTLATQQNNGGTLTATQEDAARNVSLPGTVTAPDLIAPLAPTAIVSADGTTVTGAGEAGARIVVTDPAGTPIGVTIVAADGSYAVTLSTPQANGERLLATQTDGGGNVSPPVAALAPDITPPAAPTLAIAGDGTLASGVGEANATVTVTGPGGFTATVTADANGNFSVPLTPARLNGEGFTAIQVDGGGNPSPVATATAPDTTAPLAPSGTVAGDGASISGLGEAGATVTATNAAGTVLGSAVVAANGSFTIPLSAAQIDGEPLTIRQADPAGNASPGTGLTAPDLVAPAAPTATVAIGGASVSGLGEAGATIVVTAPGGGELGRTVAAADGSYTVALSTPQTNGELLGVSQSDGGGISPVTPAVAPDSTPPLAPVATVTGDGGFVTGTGEIGATVTVTNAAGTTIGTGVVGGGGTYAVQLTTAQTDGETLTVTQRDPAGNVSAPVVATAPDLTAPAGLTATVSTDGALVTGVGAANAAITVTLNGVSLGTATADATGAYSVTLSTAQRNGELLNVVQADGAGNASPPVLALAPDLTAPAAPTATVVVGGTQVIGSGEPGATVTIRSAGGVDLGTALVAGSGAYQVTLTTPQRNGESLTAIQTDAARNVSAGITVVAPDITAPAAPAALAVNATGTTLSGTGEIGARVEVRSGTSVLGNGVVGADGTFTVNLLTPQVAGATLAVTLADAAGNVSGAATVVAPFDIQAFGNAANATIDLLPVVAAAPTAVGSANYLALVSAGALNLQAQVLGTPSVRFTVQDGHNLAASFTYDATLNIGVTSGYSVVVQRFDGTQWVAVNGAPGGSLLDLSLLNGNLTASQTLASGEYRAFLTYQSGLGVGAGLLGSLAVSGTDIDYTDVGGVRPVAATGNVITDPGVGGAVDVVSPGTHVTSVTNTVTGATIAVTADGTVVDGEWGTLVINLNGSYTYTPDVNAAAIGHTDVFSYAIIDPSDNEVESANLSITVGSGAITGAPVAVADVAFAPVTYANVVETAAPITYSFTTTPAVQLPLLPVAVGSHGERTDTFVVAPNTDADITIRASTAALLSVAPNYTLTLTNLTAGTTQTITNLALAGVGGASTSFTLNDLPAGNYRYTLAADAVVGSGFSTTVTLARTTTLLDSHVVVSPAPVEGSLLANDDAHSSFVAVRVGTGNTFTEVGNTPLVINGAHGTLTVDEVGHYVYQPSATLAYSTTDLTDSFTYQLVQPNGVAATTTLNVTIDVPGDNASAMVHYAVAPVYSIEPDVVSLDTHAVTADAHLATAPAVAATGDGTAIGLATYQLFEGRGELEDVLSHYLATQQNGIHADALSADHSAAVAPVAAAVVADPLDYLATLDDQTHHGTTVNHVV